MDWQEEYKSKLVTAAEAVSIIKSGDRVVFPLDLSGTPAACGEALAVRLDELKDVEIHNWFTLHAFPWFQPGWEGSFKVTALPILNNVMRQMVDEKRADYSPLMLSLYRKAEDEGRPGIRGTDVCITVVSPPDRHGFCSFGGNMWCKKWYVENAKKVIAEVDSTQPRTFGANFIHVSQIDYLVENTTTKMYLPLEPQEYMKTIGEYVSSLVRDGDTIAIGGGQIGFTLAGLGVFDDRHDLGYHSENLMLGIVRLVKEGVITGKYKTIHPGKVVCNNFCTGDLEELNYVADNPMFELYAQEYVINIRTVAAHDNMVAMNSALAVDFTGQISAESNGYRMYSGSGGQPEFAIGAMLSKGGRSISMLRSTTSDGKISRITPFLEPGTIVTVPRNFADYVVTEYGIASLLGKSQRERARELIGIAHPDFRSELTEQARKLFWP